MPLVARGTTLGVLEIRRSLGLPFSDAESELLSDLAAQSAVALHSARQMAIERWRIEQLSLVSSVSAQIANVLDLDTLAHRVTELILDTFKYYFVALFILEPGQQTLDCRASAGPPHSRRDQDAAPSLPQIRLGEGIIGHAVQVGTEVLANDVSSEPLYRHTDALPETQSEIALPLRIENRTLGVLDVQSDRSDAFDETDVLVLRALADQIAIAVEGIRLYNGLRRRADQLSTVAEVSRAVTSILDLETLFEEVVRLIHQQFGYPFVYLFTVDLTRGQIIYRAGIGPHAQALQEQVLVCSLDDHEGIVPWVACRGETALVNDVNQDPRYHPPELLPDHTRAELAVPLVFGGTVLGVLDVQSDVQGAFDDKDRSLFEALADNIATAIRNANLYRSERWRHQVADSLREVAGLLSDDVALDQVLEAILIELERTLPCDVAAIWLLNEDSLCLSAARGYEAAACIGIVTPNTDSWLAQALYADRPIIRTPQSPYEPLGGTFGLPPDYSAIAAPLRAGNRRLGLLTMIHRDRGRYGTESQAMTAAFASYGAVAIENTRLYHEAQELAQISTVMLQVAEATRSLTTLDDVLETIVHLVPMLVGVYHCAILLWDEFSAAFVPAAAYRLSPAQQATFDQWRIAPGDEPAFDDLLLQQAPIFIYDVATDSRLVEPVAWELDFESLLLLPLLAQGEVLGTMLLDYRSDWFESSASAHIVGATGILRDERLVTIQGIALQAAAAIENTRLREAQREEAYVSAALLQVAQAVASLSDLNDILSTIVRITPILVGVEWCVVFLWNDAQAHFCPAQAYGIPRDAETLFLSRRYAPGDFPLLDAVRERDRLIVCPSNGDSGAFGKESEGEESPFPLLPPDLVAALLPSLVQPAQEEQELPAPPPPALLGVPLSVKGQVLGAMVLEERSTLRRSRERRLEIINGVALQTAMAVQNDWLQQERTERERMARELQLAHEIQQTFMPSQSPDLSGWELAFTWQAAREVAGDFYDFFELPDRRLGLVIADVADKGMPAALFMALTRTLVRAAVLEETSPAAALAQVNNLLVPDAQSGMFVTACYAVLSLETGKLTYAIAGHNPPFLLRSRTQEVEQLTKGGMALGVQEGTHLKDHTLALEPGDCLVFYTDGITEAFSPENDIYGNARLQATIQTADVPSAQAMLDAIINSVVAFADGAAISDDRTIMILCRK
jgi:GAF domain-containing protein